MYIYSSKRIKKCLKAPARSTHPWKLMKAGSSLFHALVAACRALIHLPWFRRPAAVEKVTRPRSDFGQKMNREVSKSHENCEVQTMKMPMFSCRRLVGGLMWQITPFTRANIPGFNTCGENFRNANFLKKKKRQESGKSELIFLQKKYIFRTKQNKMWIVTSGKPSTHNFDLRKKMQRVNQKYYSEIPNGGKKWWWIPWYNP